MVDFLNYGHKYEVNNSRVRFLKSCGLAWSACLKWDTLYLRPVLMACTLAHLKPVSLRLVESCKIIAPIPRFRDFLRRKVAKDGSLKRAGNVSARRPRHCGYSALNRHKFTHMQSSKFALWLNYAVYARAPPIVCHWDFVNIKCHNSYWWTAGLRITMRLLRYSWKMQGLLKCVYILIAS